MKIMIQGIEYNIECVECGSNVRTTKYQIDEMNYCCSEDCLEKLVD